jgi:hypothetical protein
MLSLVINANSGSLIQWLSICSFLDLTPLQVFYTL